MLRFFCVVLLCFASLFFRLYAVVEAAALRSIVLRYAGAPVAPRVSFFFPIVGLEMSLFPSMFCKISTFSLNEERVRRTFFPSEWCVSNL